MASNGWYYAGKAGPLVRRRTAGSQDTKHKAVDRHPQPSPTEGMPPSGDPMAAIGATTQPPRRPFVPYIPNENTGITGMATKPFNSPDFMGMAQNPLMDYLQRMLQMMRPR